MLLFVFLWHIFGLFWQMQYVKFFYSSLRNNFWNKSLHIVKYTTMIMMQNNLLNNKISKIFHQNLIADFNFWKSCFKIDFIRIFRSFSGKFCVSKIFWRLPKGDRNFWKNLLFSRKKWAVFELFHSSENISSIICENSSHFWKFFKK